MYLHFCFTSLGSRQIYVARAEKKYERAAKLKQLYEDRRIERLQKYQVNSEVKFPPYWSANLQNIALPGS